MAHCWKACGYDDVVGSVAGLRKIRGRDCYFGEGLEDEFVVG